MLSWSLAPMTPPLSAGALPLDGSNPPSIRLLLGPSPRHCAGTTKRPVPLQHNLYYSGQLFTICQGESYQMQARVGAGGSSALGVAQG